MVTSKDLVDSHLSFQKSIIEYEDYVLHFIKPELNFNPRIENIYPLKSFEDRIIVVDDTAINYQNYYQYRFDRVQNRLSQFSYIWKETNVRNHY